MTRFIKERPLLIRGVYKAESVVFFFLLVEVQSPAVKVEPWLNSLQN